MKKSILFYLLSAVPLFAGCYDLFVGGSDGLLEAAGLFILALIFIVLGSTFYIGYRLQNISPSNANLSASLSWFQKKKAI